MNTIPRVSDTLADLLEAMSKARDAEIAVAAWQYAGQAGESVNADDLAKAWDKMLNELAKWHVKARDIEASCKDFYGTD